MPDDTDQRDLFEGFGRPGYSLTLPGIAHLNGTVAYFPELTLRFYDRPLSRPTRAQRLAQSRANARRLIEIEERQYRAGDKTALIRALCHREQAGLMRCWADTEMHGLSRRIAAGEVSSWNELIGPPRPKQLKGKHRAALERRRKIRVGIYLAVHHASRRQVPIDDGLFAKVGRQFGVRKTYANKCYYEVAHHIDELAAACAQLKR